MIRSQTVNWRIVAIVVIAAAICMFIYWPALRWMFNSWASSDYYSHGFLVPLVSGFFIWTKRRELENREPSMIGVIWIIAGAILYIVSLLWQIRFLGILSLISVIVGLVFSIWGLRTARALLFPLGFLLFMVPFWFIQDLAYNLQVISVQWSSYFAGVVGLPIKYSGANVYMGNITFTIGIVCSGINTLVALLALAAVYSYALTGPISKRVGLFVLAFPIAIAANVLRIFSILLVSYFVNVGVGTGWYHDISSPLFFLAAFLGLVLIGRALKLRLNYQVLSKQ
jgi:exosortase